ncbi:hypothetical protein [Staphylococcus xylosus]|uniref:hypothetical protein n=1 Tax=Staphylococcus xylosus TaxID=1288 RepID=UPI00114D391A|nr:hypothetical protein [Staphylococcus xylosus]
MFQNIKSFSIRDYSIEVDVSKKIKATYDSISSISVEKYGFDDIQIPYSLEFRIALYIQVMINKQKE